MTYQYYYILNKNEDKKMDLRTLLKKCCIKFSDKGILLTYTIHEANTNWVKLHRMSEQLGCTIRKTPLFSKSEIESAEYFAITIKDYIGYPEPQDYDKLQKNYIDYTYNRSIICTECGMVKKQVNSFYLKESNKILQKKISTLYWVNDELFVARGIVDEMKKAQFNGIVYFPVRSAKTKDILDWIVQIKIEEEFPDNLLFDSKKIIRCSKCGLEKFILKNETLLKYRSSLKDSAKMDFYKSAEFFGEGLGADRLIIISKKVREFFNKNKVVNINYTPLIPD